MNNRTKSYLVFGACLFMIAMVILSNYGVFGGRTVEQVSNLPGEILVPAGFTFAIWGVIYLGMLAFAIYQLRDDTLHDTVIQNIRPWVGLNFIANGLWLPAATMTNRSWMTVILIIFMWWTLRYINTELSGYAHTKATRRYIVMPMSIYFGWLTVATPLNMASVISQRGFPEVVQTVPRVLGWIILACIVYTLVFNKLRYLSYISVLLWSLIGIIVARQTDAPVISWIAVFLFAVTVMYIIVRGAHKKVILQ